MKFPAFERIDLKNDCDSFSIIELNISQISPNVNQPRKHFEDTALEELADSIKQYGVIQPIIVKEVLPRQYEIIVGERRWRASQIAELSVIPAIIQDNKARVNLAISLIENIQREELNPIELAEVFYKLNKEHSLSHEAIALMVGKSRTTVTNILRLLNLCCDVRVLLLKGKIEMGHSRALLCLPSEQQILLARSIIEKKLTVREVEQLVKQNKQPKKAKKIYFLKELDSWVEKLSSSLSSKVGVNISEAGEGRVVIHFSSPDEVDWLVSCITNGVNLTKKGSTSLKKYS